MTPQEKAKDRRLRKTYGWTLEMYNQLLELQGGVCYGCGRPPKKAPLNVDHYHFKIKARRTPIGFHAPGWEATTDLLGGLYYWGGTKTAAIRLAREASLPKSVRGLLCAGRHGTGCNTKLGRIDNPTWLRRMADYVENPPAGKILK